MDYDDQDKEGDIDFLAEFSDVTPLKQLTIDYVPSIKDSLAKQLKRQNIEQSIQLANNYLSMECCHYVDPYDQLAYKKPGVQEGVFKNLRLGKYRIEHVINVQQCKFEQARYTLFNQIMHAYQTGVRTLLLKHGIGLHSKPVPAMLKSYVNQWLQQMPQVLAFHSAMPQHSGYAATYVLIKKNETEKWGNRELHRKK
ncbi:DNA endonuclease SmrA [Paraglaciecola hydrolytica]|uniref:DNA mismatch repair protein MutS n=1 Tax=Paraglaciecola hydrolytica TaxID=1799789 RepID=A0A148KNJ0_9ALTE|nr:DNA endonuclease SmrA [Paraglaciecola hydrolytica]KXI27850.1 DNA mismatch repair protein MutS [Paraglaciecola hydrolytica]